MNNKQILKNIDELLEFLPKLYSKNFNSVKTWHEDRLAEGLHHLPYPEYNNPVNQFFHTAAQEFWQNYQDDPIEALEMLNDKKRFSEVTLEQIKAVLTYFVRRERFCDGLWASVIDDGQVKIVLNRLNEIRNLYSN